MKCVLCSHPFSDTSLQDPLREAIIQSNTCLLILNVPSSNGMSHMAAESCWHFSFTYSCECPSDSSGLWDIWINEVALCFLSVCMNGKVIVEYSLMRAKCLHWSTSKHFSWERLRTIRAVLFAWKTKVFLQRTPTVKDAERIQKQTLYRSGIQGA